MDLQRLADSREHVLGNGHASFSVRITAAGSRAVCEAGSFKTEKKKGGMRMKKLKRALALALCLGMMAGMTVRASGNLRRGVDYSAVFDAEYYYDAYPDVQETFGHDADRLLEHFVTLGMKEGRVAKADFDVRAYMKNNLDLLAVYGARDLSKYYYHYMESGKAEGRIATANRDVGELASFSTVYNTAEDRAVNVELAAQRINGMIVQPGETFSFSNSIQSRTLANGYVVAPSFASGRVVSSVGGGICQVSSTLYVTMLMAGIPATERYAHSLEVDYVPKGLDSAIVEGHKDLRFRNPYDYPVCIHSLTQDGTLTVSIAKADAAAGKQ